MANGAQQQAEGAPGALPNVPATSIGQGAAYAQQLGAEIKEDIKEIRRGLGSIQSDRHSDFKYYISVFGTGFLLLAGMMTYGYFRLDDRINALTTNSTRIDAKLEELLKRTPVLSIPAPTSPPKR